MSRWASFFKHPPGYTRSAALLLFLLFLLSLSTPQSASAHPLSVSNTSLQIEPESIELVFAIDDLSVMESVADLDRNHNQGLDAAELEPAKETVAAWLSKSLTVQAGDQVLTAQPTDISIQAKSGKRMVVTTIRYVRPATVNTVSFKDGLYTDGSGTTTYVNLLVVRSNGQVNEKALSGDNRTAAFTIDERGIRMGAESTASPQSGATKSSTSTQLANSALSGTSSTTNATASSESSWHSFFMLGIHHILTGYDHLLFLLALLLRRQPLLDYLKIATAFTIAHSLTLTLAVLGWNPLPSKMVEILIALSIVYVAVENIWDKNRGRRWQLAFAFGLVHGLGFASILAEMDIPKSHLAVSLISFNVGIEVVQLGLIVLASPLLSAFQASRIYRKGIAIGSSAIILVGGFWVIERMM